MKEHSIFLEAAFTMKDKNLMMQADHFKNEFTKLLSNAVTIANGVISPKVLASNEIVTKYTLSAEKATQAFTGIVIDSSITTKELSLSPGGNAVNILLADKVSMLNRNALTAVNNLIAFKTKINADVLSCRIITHNYPSMLEHIIEEAMYFKDSLTKLQNNIETDTKQDILQQQIFFDDIMSEHSFFIRGLLDPTEKALFNIADTFGKEFELLTEQASTLLKTNSNLAVLTNTTIDKTTELRDFKAQGTEGILACKIKSLILPLLADHVLREANFYLNLLKNFKAMQNI
jgi:hypothetical protein